ncbi:MAG: trypsin-like peptidase domain-containing protein [Fuerstiella sp.]|nr:trypsin-like peptidase domain-containing protein [Fuerstiella sp.]
MTLIALMMLAADPLATPLPEVVLLDFTASYCGPCQEMVPAIQEMQKLNYPIRKVDITKHPEISRQFQVEKIPTFILLVNGTEKKRIVGKCSTDELRQMMIEERDALRARRQPEDATTPPQHEPRAVAQKHYPGSLRGIFAKILEGFGGHRRNTGFLHPTFRAQSPEPLPAETAGEGPLAATVRIRVSKQDNEEDIGTGSIVHSTSDTSTILTCAHLFHDLGRGTIDVEFFRDGRTLKYPAKIAARDDDLELAILQIRNNSVLPSVELAPAAVAVRPGDNVFSIGCDNGQMPTHMPIKVVDKDRYDIPSHIVCTIDPAVGRSGGGLFNSSGQLIGVCSCADRDHQEGLYMGRKPTRGMFEKAGLSDLLTVRRDSILGPEFSSESDFSEDELISAIFDSDADGNVISDETESAESPADTGKTHFQPAKFMDDGDRSGLTRDGQAPSRTLPLEITVIVDTKDDSRPKEVVVIRRPSPWLLKLLTGDAPKTSELAAARKMEYSATSTQPVQPPESSRRSATGYRHKPHGSADKKYSASNRTSDSHSRTRTAMFR